jgi:hypothetical protein
VRRGASARLGLLPTLLLLVGCPPFIGSCPEIDCSKRIYELHARDPGTGGKMVPGDTIRVLPFRLFIDNRPDGSAEGFRIPGMNAHALSCIDCEHRFEIDSVQFDQDIVVGSRDTIRAGEDIFDHPAGALAQKDMIGFTLSDKIRFTKSALGVRVKGKVLVAVNTFSIDSSLIEQGGPPSL